MMKSKYNKPQIIMENYEVSEFIAANCHRHYWFSKIFDCERNWFCQNRSDFNIDISAADQYEAFNNYIKSGEIDLNGCPCKPHPTHVS